MELHKAIGNLHKVCWHWLLCHQHWECLLSTCCVLRWQAFWEVPAHSRGCRLDQLPKFFCSFKSPVVVRIACQQSFASATSLACSFHGWWFGHGVPHLTLCDIPHSWGMPAGCLHYLILVFQERDHESGPAGVSSCLENSVCYVISAEEWVCSGHFCFFALMTIFCVWMVV